MPGKRCIIPKKCLAWTAGAVLALAALFLLLSPSPSLPETGERLREASLGLSRYDLTLKLDDEASALSVSEAVSFRNETGDTLRQLILRTWLNAFDDEESSPVMQEELYDACCPDGFSAGFLSVYDVEWNGEPVEWEYLDEERTVLSLQIPDLLPGQEGEIFLRCVAFLPGCAFRTGVSDGYYQLGNVIPLLSLYQDGEWRQDAYGSIGEPFLSESADFSVALSLPEGYTPACTAYLEKGKDGLWRGEALAVRDVGLAISRNYVRKQARLGDTLVCAMARDAAAAGRALEYAEKALETYSRLYGEYPWPVYTVCSAAFPPGGMEYPCLSVIDEKYFAKENQDTLELVIAHETAHQWFYNLVGSDQVNDPWQDEGLCEYAMLRYVKERYGQGSFENLKSYRVDAPMQEDITGTVTPGSPIGYFSSLSDYVSVVYGRGAALMLALDEITSGGMDSFLHAYAEEFSFSFAAREDFEHLLSRYTGMDLAPLMTDYLDTLM